MNNLKKSEYDLVIDCKNVFSFNNAVITLFSKGKIKIGFENIYSDRYLDYALSTKNLENLHESEYLAMPLMSYFGIEAEVPEMSYYLKTRIEDRKESDKKVVGIHIGGRGQKTLSVSLINNILKNLKECKIKIIYGPDEIEKLKLINCVEGIERVFPKNMEELAVLIASLDVFITPDTGPLHIASALNQNIIAIFTGNTFQRYGPKTKKKSLCIDLSEKSEKEAELEIKKFVEKI